MKNRKVSDAEKKRVLRYGEFVLLLCASIFVNFKLATYLFFLVPVIIPIIVGLKDKNYHFFQETKKNSNLPTNSEIFA